MDSRKISVRSRTAVGACILALLTGCQPDESQLGARPPSSVAVTPAPIELSTDGPLYERTGVKVGEQIANYDVSIQSGETRNLHSVLGHHFTLLLASSLTCPKSRSMYPDAAALAARFGIDLEVVVVYVIEAHPFGDICPYKGTPDETQENHRDGILRRQPKTATERERLAAEFKDRLHVENDVVIDSMDNRLWRTLGAGPNMGVLVDEDGVVLARQGWFDAEKMAVEIERLRKFAEPVTVSDFPWEMARAFVDEKDFAKARDLLLKQPDLATFVLPLDYRGHDGNCTLLQEVAQRGSPEVAAMLLAAGTDVNFQRGRHPAALVMASERGSLPMIELLLSHGANVDLAADLGHGLMTGPTALQLALLNGHREAADRLMKAGAKENFFTQIAMGRLAEVKHALLVDPSGVARNDGLGHGPLLYAVGSGQIEAAKLLMSAGALKFSTTDLWVSHPLHWAVQCKQLDMLRFLLDSGLDPNTEKEYGGTALQLALWNKDFGLARMLLDHRADPNIADLRGDTPMHYAAANNDTEAIDLLIAYKANLNVMSTRDGRPCGNYFGDLNGPLHLAAEEGAPNAARKLIDAGALINLEDSRGRTPLDIAEAAAMEGREKTPAEIENHAVVLKLLRERGGKQGSHHQRDETGDTPAIFK